MKKKTKTEITQKEVGSSKYFSLPKKHDNFFYISVNWITVILFSCYIRVPIFYMYQNSRISSTRCSFFLI